MVTDRPVLATLPCRVDVDAETTAHWLLSWTEGTHRPRVNPMRLSPST